MTKNKVFIYSFLLAFLLWLLPFILRLWIIDMPEINTSELQLLPKAEHNAMGKTIDLLSEGNRLGAFISIFINNLKGCMLNILGGVFLGLGTLINLLFNGFMFADICVSFYNAGMTAPMIVRLILPHSFELIGTWLSGGIGFYIAWLIICFMYGKESFTSKACKLIGVCSAITFLIVLLAAYVEAFITSKQL